MKEQDVFTLINQQNGNLAFKLFSFCDNSHFDHLQRNNFYTVIWIKDGDGLLNVDFSEYLFQKNTVFAFTPYQPFMFSTDKKISGVALQFHSDFYCIHRNPKETNCDTVLFNNIYQEPFISIDNLTENKLNQQLEQLKSEILNKENDNYELLIPNLKIFLVTLSRLKALSKVNEPKFIEAETPFILQNLKKAIEENFTQKHSASDYATLLNISANALAKLVKTHYNKTLTDLITERIIIEAKRELYMTSKPIKEVAWYLGYADEFHFSRLFKSKTDISPQLYRETVGFAKAELN
ncbi:MULTISPECIES: helix-turn-helix domain-containing protein [Weeksellaceae]|uniref:Regulatory protein soxS n=2 Tax=Weeksellaceae TaxID=2762318 RepID=A0A376G7H9_9FLAO|nr:MULTISPECIES: AraC family transcriptional regulator [Weeksellaceae]ROI13846.1 AraC family transcriptional regulator [Epilithonimonas hominis]STD54546.1 Regulatory protein soxS [Empedobacter falsenii]